MKNKRKKFQISLDEALKPDLNYFLGHFEQASKAQANKIFGVGEESNTSEEIPFKMEELYRTSLPKIEKPKASSDYLSFLEKIKTEAIQQAADIFKENT